MACHNDYLVKRYRELISKYCSRACKAKKFIGKTPEWLIGKQKLFQKGHIPASKGKPAWNRGLKGIHLSPDTEWKKGQTPEGSVLFVKGQVSPMKGKKRPDIISEKHFNWKGDEASYGSKHTWVYRRLGSPSECELCGTTEKRMYQWANISGEYKRNISDWMRLCVPCHVKYDLYKKREKGILYG